MNEVVSRIIEQLIRVTGKLPTPIRVVKPVLLKVGGNILWNYVYHLEQKNCIRFPKVPIHKSDYCKALDYWILEFT